MLHEAMISMLTMSMANYDNVDDYVDDDGDHGDADDDRADDAGDDGEDDACDDGDDDERHAAVMAWEAMVIIEDHDLRCK